MTANALEAQTHGEAPWQKAQAGADEFMNSTTPISNEDMKKYYRMLTSKIRANDTEIITSGGNRA